MLSNIKWSAIPKHSILVASLISLILASISGYSYFTLKSFAATLQDIKESSQAINSIQTLLDTLVIANSFADPTPDFRFSPLGSNRVTRDNVTQIVESSLKELKALNDPEINKHLPSMTVSILKDLNTIQKGFASQNGVSIVDRPFIRELDTLYLLKDHKYRQTAALVDTYDTKLSALYLIVTLSFMLITAFIVVIYIKAINARVESSKQAAILTESANKSALMLSYMSELSEMTTLLQIVPSASKALDVAKEFSARIFNPRPGAFYMVEPDSMLSLKFSWGKVDEVFEPRLKASACWGISKGQPHFSRNSSAIKCDHTSPFDHTVCVPVISQNKLEGLLIIELLEDDEANESFLRSVDAFSGQLALSFHNLQLKSELQSLSMRDPLTDLYNRRFMEESFHKLIAQCARTPFDISVAILDIDFFKKVNDTFLHAGGDYVLSEFSKLLKDSVRANDVVCRYGGEEFVVIFNGLGTQGALDKANKFREAFNNLHISYMGNTISPLSVSIGVASFRVHGTTPDQVLKAADTALYLAKKAGRNCVKVASS